MEAVIKNADKIDIYDAIDNLVENQIEDFAYGKIGQVGGAISQQIGSSYGMGVNTINRKLSKSVYDAERSRKPPVVSG